MLPERRQDQCARFKELLASKGIRLEMVLCIDHLWRLKYKGRAGQLWKKRDHRGRHRGMNENRPAKALEAASFHSKRSTSLSDMATTEDPAPKRRCRTHCDGMEDTEVSRAPIQDRCHFAWSCFEPNSLPPVLVQLLLFLLSMTTLYKDSRYQMLSVALICVLGTSLNRNGLCCCRCCCCSLLLNYSYC